jgi:hypothetical protein
MALVTTLTEHETHAAARRRRARLEALLKSVDVGVAVVAIAAGIFAVAATPPSIVREVSVPFLVWFWGLTLMVGGIAAGAGRISGIWILETSGIMSMATGTFMYLAVVSTALRKEPGVAVPLGLIVIALLAMLRRYVELQLFLSDPDDKGFWSRVNELVHQRT